MCEWTRSRNIYYNIIFAALVLLSTCSGDKRRRFPHDQFIDKDEDFESLRNSHDYDDKTGCPKEFQERCDCRFVHIQDSKNLDQNMNRGGRDKFVVKCENSGFTNTSMLQFMPDYTEELVFTGNMIPILHRNLFGKKEYLKLKKINLSNNKIHTIEGQAFHRVASVETLILNSNQLSGEAIHDHPRMFSNFYNLKELHLTDTFTEDIWTLSDLAEIFHSSNLTQLTKLHLEQNELELIGNLTIFCSLPSLLHLYLGQNKLSDLSLDTFCFKKLEFIDLRRNRIRSIGKDSGLWKMTNLTNQNGEPIRVDLVDNPFNCDCNLNDFISWLRKQSLRNADIVSDNEVLKCTEGLPPTNRGLYVKEVEDTLCPPQLQMANYNGITTAVIWLLTIILTVVLVTAAYWNRAFFRRQVRPLLEPSTHGVKYTSIEKNEEAEIAHV